MQFLLSLSLAAVMLFAIILSSCHHHDLADHPDCAICAICAVAHHVGTVPDSPTLSVIVLPVLPVLFALLILTVPVVRPSSLLRSRAPPQ